MSDRAGRRWPAVDVELHLVTTVGAQPHGQDAAILAGSRLLLGVEYDRAGAVAEQHAGAAIGPVEKPGKRLGADHQRPRKSSRLDEPIGHSQSVDEARTYRLEIESGAMGNAKI